MEKNKFAIIGTRGIPASYGGFETFAEEVSIRMVEKGIEVLVIGDATLNYGEKTYKGVNIHKINVSKPKNPLKFYYESIKYSKENGFNNILMCGVGGAIATTLFSKKKINIFLNPDGLGFKRDKYPWWKKIIFYSQYYVASKLKNVTLVYDSIGIQDYFQEEFKRKENGVVIEYGSYINPFNINTFQEILTFKNFKVEPNKYHLIVSRLEPENNVEMIIQGYKKHKRKYPLIVVGNTNTKHAKLLLKYQSEDVLFVEGIYDKEKLQTLRAASFSYLHGHSVGGTNPSLLEAMGSANFCICHDNVFNREVVLDNGLFFKNENELDSIFNSIEKDNFNNKTYKDGALNRVVSYYNWENITTKYVALIN